MRKARAKFDDNNEDNDNPRSLLLSFKNTVSKLSFEERERIHRQEMKKMTPSYYDVAIQLRSKQLLPEIFFLFSRKGCQNAAESLCRTFLSISSKRIDYNDANDNKSSSSIYCNDDDNKLMKRKLKNKKRNICCRNEWNDSSNANDVVDINNNKKDDDMRTDRYGRTFCSLYNNINITMITMIILKMSLVV